MARPTKLTETVADRITTAIRAGNYAEPAAISAGISAATYYRWLARGERESSGIYSDFATSVRKAEADAEVHAVAVIRKSMQEGEWRAAAQYLERRYPDRWRSRQSIEHSSERGLRITTDHLADPKTREELREITRRLATAGS